MTRGSKFCRNDDLERDREADRGTDRGSGGDAGEVRNDDDGMPFRLKDDDDDGMDMTFSMLRRLAGAVGMGMLDVLDVLDVMMERAKS